MNVCHYYNNKFEILLFNKIYKNNGCENKIFNK